MNGKPWTETDTATMIRLHASGCTDDVIAGVTGHCLNLVHKKRALMGLKANYRSIYTPGPAFAVLPALSRTAIEKACK